MAQTFIHYGPHHHISPTASPGLLFLKQILPALDTLGPFHGQPELANYLAPGATFTINNGPPVEAANVLNMLEMRAQKLSKFGHNLETAWDIDKGDGTRTVMYESTSVTVFKEDAEGVEVRIKEFNLIELESKDTGKGWIGLHAVKLVAYLDGSPVTERAEAMKSNCRRP
ncbi:hypothetical protein QQS21_003294 [Conoideocrella luteorostrata]|uniref:Uncharacterized protein n=1 Tax=Conoideocrella luteorostrata TaxID=1105319 RepID=A0AAJ0G2B6_9HYPO|nr:hypothetical protein QQS21_003294 [Conoideocrella luteorostrata]